jgi:hypothetical protein
VLLCLWYECHFANTSILVTDSKKEEEIYWDGIAPKQIWELHPMEVAEKVASALLQKLIGSTQSNSGSNNEIEEIKQASEALQVMIDLDSGTKEEREEWALTITGLDLIIKSMGKQ